MAEKRERVAVLIGIASKFLYGFQSPNKDEAEKLALELIEVAPPSKDVAFSPKNIKPFRAYKPGVVARGGLCGYNKVAELQNTGYVLSRKVPNTPKAGLKSVIVGVRLTPSLVFAWRMPSTKWVALPTDIKQAAGIQLATAYPASEIAYHADGFMFTAVNTDLDLPAETYISKASLKKGFTSSGNKYYTVYAGKPLAAVP